MTSEPGTFARSTIVERKPHILRGVLADNDYPPDIVAALHAFGAEIAGQPIRPLSTPGPDVAFWNRQAARYQGRTWLELPWYFAEAYFYRRLLEAVAYFEPGPLSGHDPFGRQKRAQEKGAAAWWAAHGTHFGGDQPEELLEMLLHSCLWGNRADLSNITVHEQVQAGLAARAERQHLLIDHTSPAVSLLAAGLRRVDVVTDNTGHELLFDLALAEHLLSAGHARQVVLNLKGQPFFVSDATVADALHTIELLAGDPLGARLDGHLAAGSLRLADHPFWTTCLVFQEMSAPLAAELGRADLVVLKGDANYRRLLADRHWPPTARVEDIASYFPASVLLLRTLKAEIVAGLEPGQAEALSAVDPTWLTNGKRGIVQLIDRHQVRRT